MEQQVEVTQSAPPNAVPVEGETFVTAVNKPEGGVELVSVPEEAQPVAPVAPIEEPKVERPTKLVPIELKNVNLHIELRVPAEAGQEFAETQKLIAQLREKFGNDVLIEQLSQILCGTVEKVGISYAEPSTVVVTGTTAPAPQQPKPVSIPQTFDDFANYPIMSNCPWKGNSLKNLDPAAIYKILYDPSAEQHRSILSQQDLTMMAAYYKGWYERQPQQPQTKPVQQAIRFEDDDIPY